MQISVSTNFFFSCKSRLVHCLMVDEANFTDVFVSITSVLMTVSFCLYFFINLFLHLFLTQRTKKCSRRRLVDVLEVLLRKKKYAHLLQESTGDINLMLRFAADGAKLSKYQDSVRGVMKIVLPRPDLSDPLVPLSMSPDDETTLFLYTGKYQSSVIKSQKWKEQSCWDSVYYQSHEDLFSSS